MDALRRFSPSDALIVLALSGVFFGAFGTVSALWPNPLFMRMTPTSGFEIALLAVQSALLGACLGVRRAPCAGKLAGTGGVLGFLGVACPVCNKVLLLIFGGNLLLAYFEPIRLHVGIAGTFLVLYALYRKLSKEPCGQGAPAG